MESSPGTGEAIHGPPHASHPTGICTTSTSTSTSPVSSNKQSLSHSSSLLLQKRSSLPPRSHAGARHAKRLTLNFPINIPLDQPASASDSVASPGSMTPVTQSSTRPSPALPAGTPLPFDDDDGYDFLRAIASQERRVMELREELHRAEADLSTIKKQWALSEKSKKRTEINLHAEPMLPLRSPELGAPEGSSVSSHRREQSMSSVGSSSVSQERLSRELDRRTNLRVAAPPKGTTISANGRRVFQGSHARTLSLLSPVTAPSSSIGAPGPAEVDRVGRTPRSATLPSVERSSTSSIGMPTDESQVPDHVLEQWRKTLPPPSREALVRTGKQMASDLREGLWTFFEDIRQATVGEEGISATESRTMSPSSSLAQSNSRKRESIQANSRSRERLSVAGDKLSRSSSSSSRGRGPVAQTTSGKDTEPADISKSFWHEFGVDSPAQMSPGARRSPSNSNNNTNNTADATTPRGENEPERPDRRSGSPVETEDDTIDNWDMWDTPLPASKMKHTPNSSRSTVESSSKRDQSPTTQGSSPRTSARYISTFPDFIYDNLVMR